MSDMNLIYFDTIKLYRFDLPEKVLDLQYQDGDLITKKDYEEKERSKSCHPTIQINRTNNSQRIG